ncbi:MAG: hypothetical protein KIG39_05545 [Lachnospiraceae bacterium]|nr:hypothetical protein [Lachnospiraceae bacterium]
MKILFCKISSMKYYKGVRKNFDEPRNGGSFVIENGYGHEEHNFNPTVIDGEEYCLGFVETKTTSAQKQNELHIEKISGCELLKKDECVDDVLVVWCATEINNVTSVVGWYKHATVYRNYCFEELEDREQYFNIIAKKEDCTLIPFYKRNWHGWCAPVAKVRKFGFGQSMIWYASEEKAQNYINQLCKYIDEYDGENAMDEIID